MTSGNPVVWLVGAVVFWAALFCLWYGARRNGYGRTADGAAIAVVVSGVGGIALRGALDQWPWALLALALVALVAMFMSKGELK